MSDEETDGPPAPAQPRNKLTTVMSFVSAMGSLKRISSDEGMTRTESASDAGSSLATANATGGAAPPLRRKMSFMAKVSTGGAGPGEEGMHELRRTNSTNEFLKKFSRNSMSAKETSTTPLVGAVNIVRGLKKWSKRRTRSIAPLSTDTSMAALGVPSGGGAVDPPANSGGLGGGLGARDAEEEEDEDEEDDGPMPPIVIPHDSTFLLNWLWIVALFIYYNLYIIIFRIAFYEVNTDNKAAFATLDYLCDAVYALDILVRMRTGYLEGGVMVVDPAKLRQNYMVNNRMSFYLDLASLMPLDFLYIGYGFKAVFRLPRLIKSHRLGAFYFRVEAQTNYPFVWRISRVVVNILLTIHWIACFYWLLSESEGFGTNRWVYPKPLYEFAPLRRKYIFSLYWATLVLTTIGDQPTPVTNYEYCFTLMTYIMGVFVFATVVGNIGNMISNMNATQEEFKSKMDAIKQYMHYRGVDEDLQKRVKRWYDYTWQQQHVLDETLLLRMLPDNLRADIALHVNLNVLKKVPIFKDCEPGFFRDLVLQLKPQIFSPGDYVCRKGEIGRDMYIINHGKVEVVSDDGKTVFATLQEGSYFGEISVLSLGNSNRRTAHVRSVGFSDLFQLSKADLHETLKDYPEARGMLAERAQKLLSKDSSRQTAPTTATLRRDSRTGKYIDQDADSVPPSPSQSRRGSTMDGDVQTPDAQPAHTSNSDLRRQVLERSQTLHTVGAQIDWERQVSSLVRSLPPSVGLADVIQRVCADFTAFRPQIQRGSVTYGSQDSLDIMSPPPERSVSVVRTHEQQQQQQQLQRQLQAVAAGVGVGASSAMPESILAEESEVSATSSTALVTASSNTAPQPPRRGSGSSGQFSKMPTLVSQSSDNMETDKLEAEILGEGVTESVRSPPTVHGAAPTHAQDSHSAGLVSSSSSHGSWTATTAPIEERRLSVSAGASIAPFLHLQQQQHSDPNPDGSYPPPSPRRMSGWSGIRRPSVAAGHDDETDSSPAGGTPKFTRSPAPHKLPPLEDAHKASTVAREDDVGTVVVEVERDV